MSNICNFWEILKLYSDISLYNQKDCLINGKQSWNVWKAFSMQIYKGTFRKTELSYQ